MYKECHSHTFSPYKWEWCVFWRKTREPEVQNAAVSPLFPLKNPRLSRFYNAQESIKLRKKKSVHEFQWYEKECVAVMIVSEINSYQS